MSSSQQGCVNLSTRGIGLYLKTFLIVMTLGKGGFPIGIWQVEVKDAVKTLQCMEQPPITKYYVAQNVRSTTVGKTCTRSTGRSPGFRLQLSYSVTIQLWTKLLNFCEPQFLLRRNTDNASSSTNFFSFAVRITVS